MGTSPLKIRPSIPLDLGWIPYWNLRPMGIELKKLAGNDITFHSGSPALVNRMLSEGKVRVAACSSVCLLKNKTHQLAYPLGVSSTGPVKSVYIGFHHGQAELLETIKKRHKIISDIFQTTIKYCGHDIRKSADMIWNQCAKLPPLDIDTPEIIMTPASAASATFTRILMRLWFGEPAIEISPKADHLDSNSGSMSSSRPLELLIGDEALIRRKSFVSIIDLGDAWTTLSNLPFVFAVWQNAGKTMSPYWGKMIGEAASRAQTKMRVDPMPYYPENDPKDITGHAIDLGAYWKHINYKLGPSHFHGLTLFLALARNLNPAIIGETAMMQVLKCQELAQPSLYSSQ